MKTFKEFLNEQEDDPFQAFLKMRQAVGWTGMKDAPKGTATPPPASTPNAPIATRSGTRSGSEGRLSNEVQAGHKLGGKVSTSVIARLTQTNPEDARSFIAPDRMKAGQAYPFIQQRQGGKDVPGMIMYNQMFPLFKLLELLGLN